MSLSFFLKKLELKQCRRQGANHFQCQPFVSEQHHAGPFTSCSFSSHLSRWQLLQQFNNSTGYLTNLNHLEWSHPQQHIEYRKETGKSLLQKKKSDPDTCFITTKGTGVPLLLISSHCKRYCDCGCDAWSLF